MLLHGWKGRGRKRVPLRWLCLSRPFAQTVERKDLSVDATLGWGSN